MEKLCNLRSETLGNVTVFLREEKEEKETIFGNISGSIVFIKQKDLKKGEHILWQATKHNTSSHQIAKINKALCDFYYKKASKNVGK